MEYQNELEKVFLQLGISGIFVLATSMEDKPTVRSMSYVIKNERLYFQTNRAMEKAKQMEHNSNVAICQNNIAVQGTAYNRGGVLAKENSDIMEIYQNKHEGSYHAYSHMEGAELFEITPTFITLWIYIDGEPYRKYFDCMNRKVWMEHYEHDK